MTPYCIVCLILAAVCIGAGARKLRNRRVGLRAPLPHVTDTAEYRYMKSLARLP